MKLTLSIVFGILILYLIVGLGLQAHYALRMSAQFAAGTKHLEDKVSRYENLQRQLGETDVFGRPRLGKDASSFLNRRVRWPDSAGELRYLDDNAKGRVALTANIPLSFDKSKVISFKDVDFSWLKEVAGFDYWDLSQSPPVLNRLAALKGNFISPSYFFGDTAEPVFSDIYAFMRLRLMHGIATRTLRAALAESRKMAQLIASTETVNGYVVAGLMVVSETEAFDFGTKLGIIRAKEWTPIRNGGEILKNGSIQPFAGYFGVYSNPELVARTVANPKNNVGRCLAMIDGTREIAKYAPFLKSKFLFERDFSSLMESLENAALDPSNKCRFPYVRKFWEGDPEFYSTKLLPFWQRAVQYMPYFRRAFAYRALLDSRDIVVQSAAN
jgi:hypothetical protein